jgi:hypothetical protein
MALLLRVLRAALGSVARASGLFIALFLGYLLWSAAWPAYRAATHLAAQRPHLQALVESTERDLGKRQVAIEHLEVELLRLSRQQEQQLQERISGLTRALEEESERLQRLVDELAAAAAEREKYCRSWNPIKRWMCAEVEARTNRTREVVEPLVQSTQASRDLLSQQLDEAKRAFAAFDAGEFRQRAQSAEALLLRAALAEQANAAERTKQTLADARRELRLAVDASLSPWNWLQRELFLVGPSLFGVVFLVLVTPWLQRVFAYFAFMPLVERARAIQLVESSAGRIKAGSAERSLAVSLEPGEKCWARAEYVRPVEGYTRSQWLFDWGAPFVSYAAGLSILTRIEVPADTSRRLVTTLSSPEHSDSYLIEVSLDGASGFVFHPRHLVAVIGEVQLWTVWRVWSLHAWATGQLRYIAVRGTGRCVFEGFGDLVAATVDDSRQRIEQELVVAFDAGLEYGTARTETFLPYLLGRTPLVDDVFTGRGIYLWQKNTRRHKKSFAERSFDAFFGAIGKLLGF